MQITDTQLKALQLAHDAVRASAIALSVNSHVCIFRSSVGEGRQYWIDQQQVADRDLATALDTLTAAIEALKEGSK